MRKNQFFIGNVNVCSKYEFKPKYTSGHGGNVCGFGGSNWEAKIYRKMVPLLKLKNGNYVCLDSIDSLDSYIDLYKYILNFESYAPHIILFSHPFEKSDIFVDEKSLVPYYDICLGNEKTSIKKVKEDLLLDPRLSRSIDYENDEKIIQKRGFKIKRKVLK